MSKHHQSKAEQIHNKAQGTHPFENDKNGFSIREPHLTQDPIIRKSIDDSFIQHRAYEIYNEKGGSALENWLEAERLLLNDTAKVLASRNFTI